MPSCEALRPLLFKVSEREISPKEAMRVARHLAGCTNCKILLARERRLARMLEVDLQDIPVGEDFFQSVMASLPKDPPPAPVKKNRHGLKLAGFAGLIGAGTLFAARGSWFSGRPGLFSALPSNDFETASGGLEGLFDIARLVLVALKGMSAGIGFDTPLLAGNLGLLGGAAVAVLMALGAGSALFALVARFWMWPSR
jgi:anti-sigma factor RsiW